MKTERWAVENTNLITGDSVRFMETSQDWVAKHFADEANKYFESAGLKFKSSPVRI